MDNQIAEKLMKVNNAQMRKFVVRKLHTTYPEIANSVSGKLLNEAMIYSQGYADAIKPDVMPPYNKEDLQGLLLDQGFNYIVKKLS